MSGDPPDYGWISRLYGEIRFRLAGLLSRKSTLRLEIEEKMDQTLFDQMIKNDAFDGEDMYKLVCYVFDKCEQLGSPGRDSETREKKKELIDLMRSSGASFSTIVPLFIRNSNYCIDMIYYDLWRLRARTAGPTGK